MNNTDHEFEDYEDSCAELIEELDSLARSHDNAIRLYEAASTHRDRAYQVLRWLRPAVNTDDFKIAVRWITTAEDYTPDSVFRRGEV